MLSIKAMKGGGPGYYLEMAQLNYYDPELTGEPPGLWYGKAALEFGLSGEVEREHLERLCEGFHPFEDGKRLVRNAGRHSGRAPRDPGFDATFSAPKSVSVAWAMCSDELRAEIERKDLAALKQALDYLESQAVARVGAQGQEYVRCPLVWAIFRQATSRAGDPLIHSHCLCVNVTMHADGHTSAFDTSAMFFLKMAAGALYRAALAEGLRDLGFSIEPDGTSFRIRGIPEPLCDELSKRRQEIEQELIRRFGSLEAADAIDAAQVATDTREAKNERPRAEMLKEWQARGRTYGVTEESIRSLLKPGQTLSPEAKETARQAAYDQAVSVLSESHAHWNERELVQRTAEAAQVRGIGARDVLEVVERKLVAEREFVCLGEVTTEHRNSKRKVFKERREARYTTETILALERQLLADACRLHQMSAPVEDRLIEQVIAQRPTLSREQEKAVRSLLGGGNLRILIGDAGTGKTFVLGAVKDAFEAQGSGHNVIGCALAGIAAENLQETGIRSDTIAMTLIRLRDGTLKLDARSLLVIDECGMLGSKPLAELLRFAAEAKARVLLVGDPKQLQPITQGGPLKHLAEEYGDAVARLRDIRRQREAWHREAVKDFARGESARALQAFLEARQLEIAPDRISAMRQMVSVWKDRGGIERPQETLMLTGLVAEARALNRMCQVERAAGEALGKDGLRIGGDRLYPGDRVLFTRNNRKLALKNGYTGDVLAVDAERQTLTVRLDGGRELTVPLKTYNPKHVSLGYAATTHKAQGLDVGKGFGPLGKSLGPAHGLYASVPKPGRVSALHRPVLGGRQRLAQDGCPDAGPRTHQGPGSQCP